MSRYYINTGLSFVRDHHDLAPAYAPSIGKQYKAFLWSVVGSQYEQIAQAEYLGDGKWTNNDSEFTWADYIQEVK